MAIVKLELSGKPVDGQHVTFKAPCDCTAVTGLRTYYAENNERKSMTFTMKDAHNNDLTGIGNLFGEGSLVEAVLNVTDEVVYLLNAATNGYLEAKIPRTASDVGAFNSARTDLTKLDILEWAENEKNSTLANANPTVTNMPIDGWYWVIRLDIGRDDGGNIWRILTAYQVGLNNPIHFVNTFVNTDWSGWTTCFLPLTGGKLNGNIEVSSFIGFNLSSVSDYGGEAQFGIKDRSNNLNIRYISMTDMTGRSDMSDALNFVDFKDGYYNVRKIYGEHNITCGNTEPTSLANGCIYEMYE